MSNDRNTPGRGRLFVVSAPSGAGKTTLVRRLVEQRPDLRFSVSYTTRPKREREVNGEDYFFVTPQEFERLRDSGELLEHASVFGNSYGTSRRQVLDLLESGTDVLLEIDWQGAAQVRANMPECTSIFILPPSIPELERRLRGRGTDSEQVIERRLNEALDDISHWQEFDYVVVNDDLDTAVAALQEILAGHGEPYSSASPDIRARVMAILDTARSGQMIAGDRQKR
ncbi:MAG TPA: guanylate kinase [Chromatiales bacterium]|nr:guanylate kinase [Chromatiales bacterium]